MRVVVNGFRFVMRVYSQRAIVSVSIKCRHVFFDNKLLAILLTERQICNTEPSLPDFTYNPVRSEFYVLW